MAGVSKTDRRKRSREYLDLLAFQAAKLFYEENLSPEDVFARMAGEYDVRSPRDVRLLLDRARDKGNPLVEVKVSPITRAGWAVPTDDRLSEALARAVGIRRALVAKTGALASDPKAEKAAQQSDELHRMLGSVAARLLWGIIRNGDSIGVGPGRGTGYAVDALSRWATSQVVKRFANLRVLSLTGSIMREPLAEAKNVDADTNAYRLAVLLDAELRAVEMPLFVTSRQGFTYEDFLVGTQASYLLDEDPEPPPTIGVFGVNIVNEDHYLLRPPPRHPRLPNTQAIEEELDELRQILPSCPAALMDVCVRFCPGIVAGDYSEAVWSIVRRLNSKVVSISTKKLNQAEEKIVVAGGIQKYEAVRALVGGGRELVPTTLVTDEVTATRLIKAA